MGLRRTKEVYRFEDKYPEFFTTLFYIASGIGWIIILAIAVEAVFGMVVIAKRQSITTLILTLTWIVILIVLIGSSIDSVKTIGRYLLNP